MWYKVIRLRPVGIVVACGLFCLCMVALSGIGNMVTTVASSQRKLPVYSVETEEKQVALGFNCAWDNTDIPDLLAILEQHGVKATFFVSGSWCNKYPESVQAIYAAGHEVGSHSNTHTDMTTLGQERILEEIRRCNTKILNLTGAPAKVFRTPSGAYNDLVIETILAEGMTPIQWDIDSVDYKNPSPEDMRQKILSKLRCGSIMLFHSGAQNTPEALPAILESVMNEGYTFVTVSELIYPEPYTVDFEGRQHKG